MTKAIKNRNTVLFLGPTEIKGMITMEEAVEAVEQGYREAEDYPVVNAPRRRVHSPEGVRISNFPGGVPGLGVIGSLTRGESVVQDGANQEYAYREHPVYNLWDSKTAEMKCIMMGEIFDERTGFSSIMAFRTGATTGVGIKHLAREDAKTVGLYGSGGQAENKILALSAVRDIEHIKVYSRNEDNRRAFVERMSPMVGIDMTPVDEPREVMKDVDIVICATNSNVPVFDGEWIEPGQHIVTVVGSNSALVKGGWLKSGRRENDDRTTQRADFIVANHVESIAQDEQAGLWDPLQEGLITMDKIFALGAVLNGDHPGRTSDEQVTYHFNNNGTAAADLALAEIVYRHARKDGSGFEIEIPAPG
ncbi:MAG: ornithine cyclodeaminase family protein, partial [Alphaproteobacteria bacterium]